MTEEEILNQEEEELQDTVASETVASDSVADETATDAPAEEPEGKGSGRDRTAEDTDALQDRRV